MVNCPECGRIQILDRTSRIMRCPECDAPLGIENWMTGFRVECPGCGRTVTPAEAEVIPSLEAGTELGQYRIVRCLGVGGMAEVYLATHLLLATDYALKVLKPEVAARSPRFAEQLLREARLACRLQHPNIISVINARRDPDSGLPYIVMELVDGQTTEMMAAEHPLPENTVLSIARQTAAALMEAAKYNLIHRDIKPANIMVDSGGRVKLADLGIAMREGDESDQPEMILGTPNYASPEQLRCSENVDARADIYSLGATMYHLLTGVRPFPGGSVRDIMSRVADGSTPAIRELNPSVSAETADLVSRMMALSPADRPASAAELYGILCRMAPEKEESGRKNPVEVPGGGRKGFRALLAVAVVALLAVSAATVMVSGYFSGEKSRKVPGVPAPAPVSEAPKPAPKPIEKPAPEPAPKPVEPPAPKPAPKFVEPPAPAAKPAPKPVEPPAPKLVVKPPPKPAAKLAPSRVKGAARTVEFRLADARRKLEDLEREPEKNASAIAFRRLQIERILKQQRFRPSRKQAPVPALTGKVAAGVGELAAKPDSVPFSHKDREHGERLIGFLRRGADVDLTVADPGAPGKRISLLQATLAGRVPEGRKFLTVLLDGGAATRTVPAYTDRIPPEILTALSDVEQERGGRTLLLRSLQAAGKHFFMEEMRSEWRDGRWIPNPLETAGELILLNCDVNVALPDGTTPLHLAAFYGVRSLIEMLLWNGADPNAVDRNGESPLFSAERSGNVRAAELLEEAGADPNRKNKAGKRAADFRIQGRFIRGVISGNRTISPGVLTNVDLYALTPMCGNPVQTATLRRNGDLLVSLLEARTDGNRLPRGAEELSLHPLQIAVERNWLAGFRILLRYRADPNIRIDGQPLTVYLATAAAEQRKVPFVPQAFEFIEAALEAGARQSARPGGAPDIAETVLRCAMVAGETPQRVESLLERIPKLPGGSVQNLIRLARGKRYSGSIQRQIQKKGR